MGEQNLRGVVANVLDCDVTVSEFELQLHYYVHFRTNILRKSMNPLTPLALLSPQFFYKDSFGIK